MDIPRLDELYYPVLQILRDGAVRGKLAITQQLAKDLALDAEAITRKYASGNGAIFTDRVSWALSFLAISGLLDRPKRAFYVITPLGQQCGQGTPDALRTYVREKMQEREQQRMDNTASSPAVLETKMNTPQEQLYACFEDLQKKIYDDILQMIYQKTPAAFETLVVDLLQKMGYGGEVEKSAKVTRYSRDGGIDGEIREDVLGLGKIYIQAKRYARDNVVGCPEIQKFAGALLAQGGGSGKGVFITTSRFSAEAREYADNLVNSTIVLIDGQKLAQYIYEYGLGMQTVQVLHIRKIDDDYWCDFPDE